MVVSDGMPDGATPMYGADAALQLSEVLAASGDDWLHEAYGGGMISVRQTAELGMDDLAGLVGAMRLAEAGRATDRVLASAVARTFDRASARASRSMEGW